MLLQGHLQEFVLKFQETILRYTLSKYQANTLNVQTCLKKFNPNRILKALQRPSTQLACLIAVISS